MLDGRLLQPQCYDIGSVFLRPSVTWLNRRGRLRLTAAAIILLITITNWLFRLRNRCLVPSLAFLGIHVLSIFRIDAAKIQNEVVGLADDLVTADEATLNEILRQGEEFLRAQLQAGIAADQRAVTFASILTAIIAAILAYIFSSTSDNVLETSDATVLSVLLIGLSISTIVTISVFRPTKWNYAGNNPKFWRGDILNDTPINQMTADTAQLYARHIAENRDLLSANATLMQIALAIAGVTLLISIIILVAINMFPPSGF